MPKKQVGHGFGAMLDVAAWLQRAAAPHSQNHRQVDVRVAVAVGVTAPINDHRVVEQGVAVHIPGGPQLLEESGKLLGIPLVDLRDLFDPVGVVLVVGQVMMALGMPMWSNDRLLPS